MHQPGTYIHTPCFPQSCGRMCFYVPSKLERATRAQQPVPPCQSTLCGMPDAATWINYASVYFVLKGTAGSLLGLVLLPLLKTTFGVSSVQYQEYSLIIMLPWSMKPLVAMLSEWSGRPQAIVAVASLAGGAAAVVLSQTTAVVTAVMCACVCSAEIAGTDILAEGEYAHALARMPDDAPRKRMVSAVWMMLFAGQLVASAIAGAATAQQCLLATIPLVAQVGVVTCCGKMFVHRPRTPWRPGTVVGSALVVVAAGLLPVTLYGSLRSKAVYVTLAGVGLMGLAAHMLPRRLAKANLYMFVASILYLPINGATDYFATASHACVPGGPALDIQFYVAAGTAAGAVAAAAAVALFNWGMVGWSYRSMFWVSTAVRCLATLCDVVFVLRWNLRMGIPDKVMYLAGDAVVQTMASTLDVMPMVLLTAMLCKTGSESTVYAVLAAFQNFGVAVGTTYGAVLQEVMNVHLHEGVACSYEYLPQLIVIAHMALPMLTIPLTFVLIENDAAISRLDG